MGKQHRPCLLLKGISGRKFSPWKIDYDLKELRSNLTEACRSENAGALAPHGPADQAFATIATDCQRSTGGARTLHGGDALAPKGHCVVVLGASPKPTRYSYQAVKLLDQRGYRVIPVHPKARRIDNLPVVQDLGAIHGQVHTLTLYLGPERSRGLIPKIVALAPRRVILNPGSESRDLELALTDARIPYARACTLVLLRVGQF